jgi:CBS domain-containing protein
MVTTYTVKDLMVPLAEYATVSEEATLYDAIIALEKAQEEFDTRLEKAPEGFDTKRYKHRAILVLDKNGDVVGKISQLDALRGLEPKYAEMQERPGLHRYGFTKKFMKSVLEMYHLWDSPLQDIREKSNKIPVSSFMYIPTEGEYVDEDATHDEAIHQLVVGHHQSLLVTKKGKITGILRLSDVFAAIFYKIKEIHE